MEAMPGRNAKAKTAQQWVRGFQRKLYAAAKKNGTRRFKILQDKVWKRETLEEAWRRVAANHGSAGVDGQTIEWIKEKYGVERLLTEIAKELTEETFNPGMIRRVYIPKPGRREKRPLGIPTVKDRVAQMAVKLVIEPLFDADFLPCSYGFRPKRSNQQAAEKVHQLINTRKWVVDVDLKSYFDTIPHERLKQRVRTRVSDSRTLALIWKWLKAKVLEDGKATEPERGSPQGGVLSPLLSNIYLHQLDQMWKRGDGELIRYADDLVILCYSREQAEKALVRVREIVTGLGLEVNEEKTKIRHIAEGFDFLGFTFREGISPKSGRLVRVKVPRKKSIQSIGQKVKATLQKTCLGKPVREAIARINPKLRGWANYFKIGNSYVAALKVQHRVCEELRIFVRRRHSRKDRRGYRHWPDSFFYREGLLYVPNLIRRSNAA